MGHTIQHYDYPGNADKKKVEQELANYVAKRCFQEGGHLSKIRWIDSEPCANEDEAHEKIERLDSSIPFCKCEIGIYRLQKLRFQDCTKIPAKKLLPCL